MTHLRSAGAVAESKERSVMRYIVAWLLGVPLSLIVVWYVLSHVACGS